MQQIRLTYPFNAQFNQAPFVWNKDQGSSGPEFDVLDHPYEVVRYLFPVFQKDADEAQALLDAQPELVLAYSHYDRDVYSLTIKPSERRIAVNSSLTFYLLRPLSQEEVRRRVLVKMGGGRFFYPPARLPAIVEKLNGLGVPYKLESARATCSFNFDVSGKNVVYVYSQTRFDEKFAIGIRVMCKNEQFQLTDWIEQTSPFESFKQDVQLVSYNLKDKGGVLSYLVPLLCVAEKHGSYCSMRIYSGAFV